MNLNKLLRKQTSQRKLRLFAVACCNEILHLMKDQRSINAIKIAELYADGLITKKELNAAADSAYAACAAYAAASAAANAAYAASAAACAAADAAFAAVDAAYPAAARKLQEQIAEDIFHSPKIIIPTSRSILTIAQSIYTDKCWIDMPILADALEDVGYTDSKLLDHLRSNEPHYRGCWVLDLILGKN